MDTYINNYLKKIKNADNDTHRKRIINKIYEDGFCDGVPMPEKKTKPQEE